MCTSIHKIRRSLTDTTALVAVSFAIFAGSGPARAQDFNWVGGSADYNLDTNWNPAAGAPPNSNTASALFNDIGSTTVTVTSAVTVDSVQFTTNSQSYTLSGEAITLAGASATINVNSSVGSTTQTISNVIAGSAPTGTLQVIVGGGPNNTLVLGGVNTYTGDTSVQSGGGTLKLVGSGSIANSFVSLAAVGAVLDISGVTSSTSIGGLDGSFDTLAPSAVTVNLGAKTLNIGGVGGQNGYNNFAGVIDGSGGVNFTGGFTQLINGQTYTGATTVTGGAQLILFDSQFYRNTYGVATGIANSSLVTVDAGSSLQFYHAPFGGSAPDTTFSITSLAGAGTVFQDVNTLILTNASSTFSGVIGFDDVYLSGSPATGGLTIAGGTEILTGANVYTGATTINAGATLQLGAAGTSGSVAGAIVDNGTLIINRTDVFTLGNTISGGGVVLQNGTGTTILTAVNGYTGATTVNAGTLDVEGSIALSTLTTVNAGTNLIGNGIVGNTAIAGGTLAPGSALGSAFGPLTVQGTLSFTAASTYLIQVTPTSAGRTNVSGTATLGGATVNANFAAGSYIAKQYIILNATGGLIGTFGAQANSNLPAGFHSSLSYDLGLNNVYLNLALNFAPPPNGGLNVNQQNVANAIVGFFNTNGGIPMVFGGLSAAGLTQASGELATGSQQTTFDAMNLFMGLLTDPFIAGRGDPVSPAGYAPQFADSNDASAYAANGQRRSRSERDAYAAIYGKAPPRAADPFSQRWSVWAAGYGGSQTTDGNAALGSNTITSRIFGMAVGADYRFSPNTLAGFALAGGGTNFNIANGLGSGRSDLFQAGAFVRHTVGAAYVSAALAYGWQDITTDRTVTIAGSDALRARFNANAFSGRVESGYRFVTPWMAMGITPYVAGQFTTFDLPAYAEQVLAGTGNFALSYAAKDVTASRTELGLRSDKSYALQDAILTLRGRAAWAHDFNIDRSIAATFQTLPGASFVVNGAAQAHDAALVTASAEMKWLNGFSLAATFEGEFSNVTRSYAGKGVARYSW